MCMSIRLFASPPPPPPHLVSYTNALLASQDRRHLCITPSSLLNSLLQEGGRSPSDDGRPGSEESGVRGGGVSPRPRPSPSPTGSSSSRSMSPAVGQPREGQSGYLFIKHVSSSVANPGCLSRIQIFPSRIQGLKYPGSASKNLCSFNPKNCF
jgi:hypothetical protein